MKFHSPFNIYGKSGMKSNGFELQYPYVTLAFFEKKPCPQVCMLPWYLLGIWPLGLTSLF